jgi:hypothetical protein
METPPRKAFTMLYNKVARYYHSEDVADAFFLCVELNSPKIKKPQSIKTELEFELSPEARKD